MKIKSKKWSRFALITGYLIIFSAPFDALIGIYSPFFISLFHPKWAPMDCSLDFVLPECRDHSEDFHIEHPEKMTPEMMDELLRFGAFDYTKPDPNCPPCTKDKGCRECLRWHFAAGTLKAAFFLAILSFILLPFETRTIGDYHSRIALLVFSAAFGAWGLAVIAFSWVWAPLIMLLRKFWFPIPADKTKATSSS